MEDTAAAAANGPAPETTVPSQRGQKRGRDAQDEDEARREAAVDACFMLMEAAAFMEEVGPAKRLVDYLGIHPKDDDEDDRKAAGSPMVDQDTIDAAAAPGAAAGPDEDGVRVLFQRDPPPASTRRNYDVEFAGAMALPSSGPFGFDLNKHPCSEDECCFNVVPDDAGSTATAVDDDGGSVELADGATTVRRHGAPSSGFDLDLNQPCPSELPGGARDDLVSTPAEDSLAVPDAGELPVELPDGGGGAPVSRTRRRQGLLDWAFGWANGLVLGPLGLKRSRR